VRVKQFIGSEYVTHIEQIHPPQPVESPDDWVTQDLVPSRRGIDELNWIFSGERHGSWVPFRNGPPITHGVTDKCGDIGQVRCRRRDYPQKPAEVHSGGPYVARSEYERVCVERDEGWAQAARIRDEAVKLAQARDKAIYDLNAVRATLEKRDAEVANLRHEQSVLLADLKDIEQTVIHLNKRVFADNPNGWPLVPVDPSCIPDWHRAVEVTCNAKGRKVVSYESQPIHLSGNDEWPRLVVEPIPTPPPDALPRPEFPVWIRAGWWVAMDPDSVFWVFEYEPKVDEQCGEYTSRGKCVLLSDDQLTPSMRAVPVDRWRKAKWQIE